VDDGLHADRRRRVEDPVEVGTVAEARTRSARSSHWR
jgi:hypothetical protein